MLSSSKFYQCQINLFLLFTNLLKREVLLKSHSAKIFKLEKQFPLIMDSSFDIIFKYENLQDSSANHSSHTDIIGHRESNIISRQLISYIIASLYNKFMWYHYKVYCRVSCGTPHWHRACVHETITTKVYTVYTPIN